MTELTDQILKAILQTQARGAYSQEKVAEIVGRGERNQKAYQLCDGTKTQSEIVKISKLDSGNFSRTLANWVEEGIVFKFVEGKDIIPLHIFPLKSVHFRKGSNK